MSEAVDHDLLAMEELTSNRALGPHFERHSSPERSPSEDGGVNVEDDTVPDEILKAIHEESNGETLSTHTWTPRFRYAYSDTGGNGGIRVQLNYDDNDTGPDERDEVEDEKVGRLHVRLFKRDDNPGNNDRGSRFAYLGWPLGLNRSHPEGRLQVQAQMDIVQGEVGNWMRREASYYPCGGRMSVRQYMRIHAYQRDGERSIPLGSKVVEHNYAYWDLPVTLGGSTKYYREGDDLTGSRRVVFRSQEVVPRDARVLITASIYCRMTYSVDDALYYGAINFNVLVPRVVASFF